MRGGNYIEMTVSSPLYMKQTPLLKEDLSSKIQATSSLVNDIEHAGHIFNQDLIALAGKVKYMDFNEKIENVKSLSQ